MWPTEVENEVTTLVVGNAMLQKYNVSIKRYYDKRINCTNIGDTLYTSN